MAGNSIKRLLKPGPEQRRLDPLVGKWETCGETITGALGPAIEFAGTDIYEWVEGGFFLLHRVDVAMGGEPVIGVEIISYDPPNKAYQTYFVDAHGNSSTYQARLKGRAWTLASQSDRFSGAFSEDWNTLSGRWERKGDSSNWEPWMDVMLKRVA